MKQPCEACLEELFSTGKAVCGDCVFELVHNPPRPRPRKQVSWLRMACQWLRSVVEEW